VISLQVRTERPPEGLARGLYAAPWWYVAVLGAVVVLGAAGYLVMRAVRARRRTR
jgi:hypothetical protein